jgi:hypothetical protein
MSPLQNMLDAPYIRRTRRNHGLEHATIHVMAKRVPNLRIAGRSDDNGFWLWGDVPTEQVEQAARLALKRMQHGEHQLAVHPNCGTNLLTTAFLGAGAVMLALVGSEKEKNGKFNRLPLVVMGLMMAIIVGQPLGARIQREVTTLGNPGDLEILSVERRDTFGMTAHRVTTRST